MKNGDFPASPQAVCYGPDGGVIASYDFQGGQGLTKREELAGRAMMGLLANSVMGDAGLHGSAADWKRDIVESAVEYADALLAELDKPCP